MNHPITVQIIQRIDELPRDHPHLLLRQPRVVFQHVVEHPLRKLHHHDELHVRLERVQHLDHVRMIERFHDIDLTSQAHQISLGFPVFRDKLHRARPSAVSLPRLKHLPERSLTDRSQYDVIIQRRFASKRRATGGVRVAVALAERRRRRRGRRVFHRSRAGGRRDSTRSTTISASTSARGAIRARASASRVVVDASATSRGVARRSRRAERARVQIVAVTARVFFEIDAAGQIAARHHRCERARRERDGGNGLKKEALLHGARGRDG